MPLYPGYTLLAIAAWLCVTSFAASQFQPDDAGDTVATAGVLQVGVNQGRFDYKLPRAMDTDVWSFTTVPGKVYSVHCYPIDDLSESINALPLTTYLYNYTQALGALGFSDDPSWTRGTGGVVTRTVRGITSRSGTPVRYAINVIEADDPGDPEGDDLAHATMLQPGQWHAGSVSSPSASLTPSQGAYSFTSNDVDAFKFEFEDRGIYRIELEGQIPEYYGYASWRGIASQTSRHASATNASYSAVIGSPFEFRGSGTAWFTLSLPNYDDQPTLPYRVRLVRAGTALSDDHGDTPETATPLTPGAPRTNVSLSTLSAVPGSSVRISDEDWFSVQTVAGHAYEVRVERAGIWTATLNDVIAEDGVTHRADAAMPFNVQAPSTPMIGWLRFRGRNGPPVKFGLLGIGTCTVRAIDLGTTPDDLGDPLTGAATISMASPTITGHLENPRDIDSFNIEPPAVEGQYRVTYSVVAPGTSQGFSPGYMITTGTLRNGTFHIANGTVTLTRRTNGQADSFPARLDMLHKPHPATEFPLIGPTTTYTLTLSYVGPLPVTPPPNLVDDAPATAVGAATLQPGEFASFTRQGTADLADAALIYLQPGRLYRIDRRSIAGDILTPSGTEIATDAAGETYSSTVYRFFTVSAPGLYLQRQRFDQYYPDQFGFSHTLSAGVLDFGPVNDDNPSDAGSRRLGVGVTSGTIDYSCDHDRFFVPYEAGAFYRITATSTSPLSLQIAESDYPQTPHFTTVEYAVFFRESELPPTGQTIIIASTTAGAAYQINVEKLYQAHPAEDPPETAGVRAPLNPGDTTIVVRNRAIDSDIVEYSVQAGHLYRFSFAALQTPATETPNVYGDVFDPQGRTVAAGPLLLPLHADVDEVWHLEFPNPWETPVAVTLIDLGIGDDDFGTGERNRGHTRIGLSVTGILERPDDTDLWSLDDAASPHAYRTRLTVTDLDRGIQQTFDNYYGLGAGVTLNASYFAGGATFPLHYELRIDPLPPGSNPPTTACKPDLGTSGGRTAQAGYAGDGILDNNDLIAFINLFFTNSSRADFGSSGGLPQPDGWLDSNDFIVFIDLFFAGCP